MNEQVDPRQRRRARVIMIILMMMFLAPAIAAWVVYKYFPDSVRGFGTTNYGSFVQPPRPLDLSGLRGLDGKAVDPNLFKDKWTMVYVGSSHCDNTCRSSVYIMRQIRLTQGAEMDRVGRLLVLTDTDALDQLKTFLKGYSGMTVAATTSPQFLKPFVISGGPAPAQAGRVYLVDPRGALMMYYDPAKDPSDLAHATGIRKDLGKILRATKIR